MSAGVIAAPQRAAAALMPSAEFRCIGGSHVWNKRARPGKQPDSPAPKSRRVTSIEGKFHAHPVAAVNNDHNNTTRVSSRRGPKRSQSQPLGISPRAYVIPNAEKIRPICAAERCSSRTIVGRRLADGGPIEEGQKRERRAEGYNPASRGGERHRESAPLPDRYGSGFGEQVIGPPT